MYLKTTPVSLASTLVFKIEKAAARAALLLFALIMISLALASTSYAATLTVCASDYATIQDAINAAAGGEVPQGLPGKGEVGRYRGVFEVTVVGRKQVELVIFRARMMDPLAVNHHRQG
jgi:hypothetical protein